MNNNPKEDVLRKEFVQILQAFTSMGSYASDCIPLSLKRFH